MELANEIFVVRASAVQPPPYPSSSPQRYSSNSNMSSNKNEPPSNSLGEREYYNLGSFHRPITTTNPETQTWFDRGLIWTYAFNHEEAAQCFSKAISLDPSCAMAHWGLAYCLGPNYNKP